MGIRGYQIKCKSCNELNKLVKDQSLVAYPMQVHWEVSGHIEFEVRLVG